MAQEPSLDSQVESLLATLAAGLGSRGEARPGQVEMAKAVARSVRSSEPLAVQAGTGTGKTWAYLAGALVGLRAGTTPDDDEGENRLLVATATKALQDQLADKDLPEVAAALGGGLTWAVLKGRSNYLCRQAASEAAPSATPITPLALTVDEGPTVPAGEIARLLAWAERTTTGDRAELDFEPSPAAWSAVSVGSDECPGAQACPKGPQCFAEAAYERAGAADVVVVNLHLLGAHVASGGHVLPGHGVVVIDEAHEAEDVMVSALGVTLTAGRGRAVARSGRLRSQVDSPPATSLMRACESLAAALAPLAGKRLPGGAAVAADVALALGAMGEASRQEHRRLKALDNLGDLGPRRDRAVRLLSTLAADIDAALEANDEEQVTWVEQSNSQPVLRVAPLDVGGDLARVAWSAATAVLTSATLPEGVPARLGLGPATSTLDVGSPFDYPKQALLYVPRLPNPRHPAWEAAAHDELRFLIGAAGGRTLALFTSWRAMQAAVVALAPDLPYRVLSQGDLPKPALVDQFRSDETSCLFATMGFWQGVDVPGSTCSLVVVDRLPFARPGDPLFEARRDRAGLAAFATVDVPHAATKLAQGVGRLVRRSTDRGVVAVLDSRLAEREYRKQILRALPPMRRSRDRADVTAFFAAVPATP